MTLTQIASLLNNTIIPNCFGGSAGVTIAEDLSNIADLGKLIANLSKDDLKNFQNTYVTGIVENWCESRKYEPETYGIFRDELEYGGAIQRIRARLYSAADSPIMNLENYNIDNTSADYNDGHFYGPILSAKVYTDTITKMVIHSVPLEQTRKSFTNARDVSKYNAMIEATVQNTIAFEMNALAKGVLRKVIQACNTSKKVQLLTLYNATMGYTSSDTGYVTLSNWKLSESFKLFCQEVIIRLKKAMTEYSVKYGDGTNECFCPPEDVRTILLEEFATQIDFAQSSVYHKELTDIGDYRTIQYWQNGSTALMPEISATSVHDKVVIDNGTDPDIVVGPIAGLIMDKLVCGITERMTKTSEDYIGKGDFITYYNHVAYSNWVNTSNACVMLTLT